MKILAAPPRQTSSSSQAAPPVNRANKRALISLADAPTTSSSTAKLGRPRYPRDANGNIIRPSKKSKKNKENEPEDE